MELIARPLSCSCVKLKSAVMSDRKFYRRSLSPKPRADVVGVTVSILLVIGLIGRSVLLAFK